MPSAPDDSTCRECGSPLAPEQRYCVKCGARRGTLPGAVAAASAEKVTPAPMTAKGKSPKDTSQKGADGGGWSWMPSPPAIAIAVIGMLALGVGLGSAMSEIASSAPLSTILLEYPHHAVEGAPPPAEEAPEPEEEESGEAEPEEEFLAEAPAEAPLPIELPAEPLPEELPLEPLPEEPTEEKSPLQESIEQLEREEREAKEGLGEEALPEIKHAFLIVLGEGGYQETFGTAAATPYLSRTLPKKGELLPNYFGVTGGVLANEIALLSGQGPTAETAANCPNYTTITPGTVSAVAEQVEGSGCVYGKEVKSLPTELSEKEVTWRAYVQDMEKGTPLGQSWRCRKPALGGPDWKPTATPEDLYVTWRNPVVFFSAIADGDECEHHDVGFEILTKDLSAKKKTPTLSLIFPEASELPTLIPAIMASPAYEEGGGLIMITSAQARQTGEAVDQKACCLVPEYPNLPPAPGTTPAPAATPTEPEEEEEVATKYTEESVVETGGGGQVGLLMISPFVEPGKVEETEYANHYTLLKTLATMLGVEPPGYAAEEEVPTLSPELFLATEPEGEEESTGAVTQSRRSAVGPRAPAAPRPGTF